MHMRDDACRLSAVAVNLWRRRNALRHVSALRRPWNPRIKKRYLPWGPLSI
jgi:hypothetical protein